MKKTPKTKKNVQPDDLEQEYQFDYSKAQINRFAFKIPEGSRIVVLEPDIARVFTSQESVNAVLRALIATMPKPNSDDKAA